MKGGRVRWGHDTAAHRSTVEETEWAVGSHWHDRDVVVSVPEPQPHSVTGWCEPCRHSQRGFWLFSSPIIVTYHAQQWRKFHEIHDDSNNSRLLDRSAQLSRHFLINTCISLLHVTVSINFGSGEMWPIKEKNHIMRWVENKRFRGVPTDTRKTSTLMVSHHFFSIDHKILAFWDIWAILLSRSLLHY